MKSSVSGFVMTSSGVARARILLITVGVSSSSVRVGDVMNCDLICSVADLLGCTRGPPMSAAAAATTEPSLALRAARSSVLWSAGWSSSIPWFSSVGLSACVTRGSVAMRSVTYSWMSSFHSLRDAFASRRLWVACAEALRASFVVPCRCGLCSRIVRAGRW